MWDSLRHLELPSVRLSPEEVRELIGRAQAGDREARDRLITANLRLVMGIVSRFLGREDAEAEDLFQVGCIGLLKAVERFDLNQEVRFSTYAVPLITGEIRQYLRRNRALRVGRHLQDLAVRAGRAREALYQRLGRAPTPEEIGEVVGASREEVVAALDALQPPSSLEEVVFQDEGAPVLLADQLGDEGETRGLLDGMALREALRRLPEVEQRLIRRRFFEERTQAEVARELGVSQAQISRLERRALLRLRQILTEE